MADLTKAARRALRLLDLTNLNEDCDESAIRVLCKRATTPYGSGAAVCLYPRWIKLSRKLLKGSGVLVATVANFPEGDDDAAKAAEETAKAFADGADEVDVVMPWRAFLAGDRKAAEALIARCRAKRPTGRRLKVILETGKLGSTRRIADAARLALDNGADFIKTSTGKVEVNATLEAAEVMLKALKQSRRRAGFKAAGGIRTVAQAADYLALADEIRGPRWARPSTFRFGASGLLDDILAVIGDQPSVERGGEY
jgi:deoxyribose-phosphate aldolase